MKILKINWTLKILPFVIITGSLFGQKNSEEFKSKVFTDSYLNHKDIKEEFVQHDISSVLTHTVNSRVFGFIGDNYQRFRIKFISVIKNKENPYQYFVYGKSMVKNNVCDFQGTITIKNVFLWKKTETPEIKQGKIVGDYLFYENPQQKHVGQFKGVFTSNWFIDKEGNLQYDNLSDMADGFTNNEFVGTWTSYSGTINKICNWGDDRIPMSGDLDDGTGEFHPANKYSANGWLTFSLANNGGADKEKKDEANTAEKTEWWK